MDENYIGLISGTSMDGIDAALVRFDGRSIDVLQTHEHSYPAGLAEQLAVAKLDASIQSITDVAELHTAVGESFCDAANVLLDASSQSASDIRAVGSHGQTVRHEPEAESPFSLQIGDPQIIADGTGITTIADFRTADIELGGQGAPLAPAFHEWLFREPGKTTVVLNIGGIANITVLHGDGSATTGYDTGPGNTLLDAWYTRNQSGTFDPRGEWGASGTVDDGLLARLMADGYFELAPPKSTGFEYFNLDWLETRDVANLAPADVQATLCQLTADSIAATIAPEAPVEVLVCGGGVHNDDLMGRLESALPGIDVASTASAGLDPDWVEAVAFAWLAMRTCQGLPGNLPSVTGASGAAVLGSVHDPARN